MKRALAGARVGAQVAYRDLAGFGRRYIDMDYDDLFADVGFTRRILYAGGKGIYVRFPVTAAKLVEKVAARLPKAVARFLPVMAILGINFVGFKDAPAGA